MLQENQNVKQSYMALSYVWGEHKKNLKPILVESRRVHWITYNLWTALKRIRRSDIDLVLWIDAICINQASTTEKSQQLPNMRWIYPRAEKVLCWLGEDDGTVLEAFDALKAWAQAYENPELRTKLVRNTQHYLASRRSGSQNGLSILFNRSYWRRAWCLPEVCVDPLNPPILLAGPHRLSWSKLYVGLMCMNTNLDGPQLLIGRNLEYLFPMMQTSWNSPEDLQMSTLIPQAAIREAQDPHDMIFSLLGLAERSGVEYPTPDYGKTIEETCMLYTRAIIIVDERLDILANVDFAKENDSVPSWCIKPGRWARFRSTSPDCARRHETGCACGWRIHGLDEQQIGHSYRYCATKDLKPQMRQPKHPQDLVLTLNGLALDRIATTLELGSFSKDLQECKSWAEIIETCRAFCSRHLSGSQFVMIYEDIIEAFLGTITCDNLWMLSGKSKQSHSQDRLYAAYQTRLQFQEEREDVTCMEKDQLVQYMLQHFSFRGQNRKDGDKSTIAEAGKQPRHVHDFLEKQACHEFRIAVLAEHRFLVSEQGRYGIGPRECKTGDTACLVFGSSFPFILRQIESHDADRYVLIGDAYVHGVMYGEGLEGAFDGEGIPGLDNSTTSTTFNIV